MKSALESSETNPQELMNLSLGFFKMDSREISRLLTELKSRKRHVPLGRVAKHKPSPVPLSKDQLDKLNSKSHSVDGLGPADLAKTEEQYARLYQMENAPFSGEKNLSSRNHRKKTRK